jgi:hypothetical protein
MMIFFGSTSDRSPLSSAIATDGNLFVPSGVVKKCVDARSGHTPEALRRAGHRRIESIGEELEPIWMAVHQYDRYHRPV